MEYQKYLRSAHWHDLQRVFWERHEHRCVVCGAEESLHIHHRTYEHLGHEEWEDLIPLCEDCHTLVHRLVDNGQASLSDAHLKLNPSLECPSPEGRITIPQRLGHGRKHFDVGSVPLYVEGQEYTPEQLDMMATYWLWTRRENGQGDILLSASQWKGRYEREIYTADGKPPDPANTTDRFGNYIDGMYWRTCPGGRKWVTEGVRRTMGCGFYSHAIAEGKKIVPPREVEEQVQCPGPGCDRPAKTGGLCPAHYQQQRQGRPLAPIRVHDGLGYDRSRKRKSLKEKERRRVEKEERQERPKKPRKNGRLVVVGRDEDGQPITIREDSSEHATI